MFLLLLLRFFKAVRHCRICQLRSSNRDCVASKAFFTKISSPLFSFSRPTFHDLPTLSSLSYSFFNTIATESTTVSLRFFFSSLFLFFSFLFFRDAALEKFASKTGRNINTRGILFVLYARLQSKSSQPCLLSVVSSFFFLFYLLFILPRSYSRLETAIIIALLC